MGRFGGGSVDSRVRGQLLPHQSRYTCQAAGDGTYPVEITWETEEDPATTVKELGSLVAQGFLIPSGAITHGLRGHLSLKGVAECIEPSGDGTQVGGSPSEAVTVGLDGYPVTYTGALTALFDGKLVATFVVLDKDGIAVTGEFFATLGDPPNDPRARHGSGMIGPDGKVGITLDVKWPAGERKLLVSFIGVVQEIAPILVTYTTES